jgi:hypothetical protein
LGGLVTRDVTRETGQGIVVGVNRLISTTVEDLDCLVFQSNPLYIKADSGENLAEMSDAPVRRTALEVTDFLVNRLTGPEMPHAWE